MFYQDTVTVGTTPIELTANFDSDQEFELRLASSGSVFVGSDNGVTDSDGWQIPAISSPLVLRLQGEPVWVVASSANQVLRVIAFSV